MWPVNGVLCRCWDYALSCHMHVRCLGLTCCRDLGVVSGPRHREVPVCEEAGVQVWAPSPRRLGWRKILLSLVGPVQAVSLSGEGDGDTGDKGREHSVWKTVRMAAPHSPAQCYLICPMSALILLGSLRPPPPCGCKERAEFPYTASSLQTACLTAYHPMVLSEGGSKMLGPLPSS